MNTTIRPFLLSATLLCATGSYATTWYMFAGPFRGDVDHHVNDIPRVYELCGTSHRPVCAVTQATVPALVSSEGDTTETRFYTSSTAGRPIPCGSDPSQAHCTAANDNYQCARTPYPIILSTGNKVLSEVDYQTVDQYDFSFVREYDYRPAEDPVTSYRQLWGFQTKNNGINMDVAKYSYSFVSLRAAMGPGESRIDFIPRKDYEHFRLDDGDTHVYFTSNNLEAPDIHVPGTNLDIDIERDPDTGDIEGFDVAKGTGIRHEYRNDGRLEKIIYPDGYTIFHTYAPAGAGLTNWTKTDSFGRVLSFTYIDASEAELVDPDGHVYRYFFDPDTQENPRLKVVYPDNTPDDPNDNHYREYEHHSTYDTNGNISKLAGALKAIYDNGELYLEYQYDPDTGFAIHSNKAGGVDDQDVVYELDNEGRVSRATLTNALEKDTVFHFETVEGAQKISRVEGIPTASCVAQDSFLTYDTNGFVYTETDAKGSVTRFVRDSNGLILEETNAMAWTGVPKESSLVETDDSQKMVTTWDPAIQEPSSRTYSAKNNSGSWIELKREEWTYSDKGEVETFTLTDLQQNRSYLTTWTYTYDQPTDVVPLTVSVNGPRTPAVGENDDISVYTYNNDGQITAYSNSEGHSVLLGDYLEIGLPQTYTNENGIVYRLGYHPRGWLETITVEDPAGDPAKSAITSLDYDPVGLLERMTLPDGSYLHYSYDNAQRLVAVNNNLGELVQYILDDAGNPTSIDVKNASDQLLSTQTRVYDELSRLTDIIESDLDTTTFSYDKEDNLETTLNGRLNQTLNNYDPLDRLKEVIDADSYSVSYTYDGLNQLESVTDQRNLVTTYDFDARGNLNQLISPDTGTTTYDYDAAGNRIRQLDARGIEVLYSYDSLNRLTTVVYPSNPSENITYTYDEVSTGNYGIGQLTSVLDQTGLTSYTYDHRGNVLSTSVSRGAYTHTTGYAYDLADNLIQTIYPSGRVVNHQRDVLGRTENVTTQQSSGASVIDVANNVTYLPFGGATQWTYGNQLTMTLDFDQDYRLENQSLAGAVSILDRGYTYDANGNVESITDALNASQSQVFDYDNIDRLIDADGPYGMIDYLYDGVGNRLQRTVTQDANSQVENYTYALDSNRLLSVETIGQSLRQFTYDDSGNITHDDSGANTAIQSTYNAQNRLIDVTPGTGE